MLRHGPTSKGAIDMAEKQVFARVASLIGDWQCGSYTLGKVYPVLPSNSHMAGTFVLVDDDGDEVLCWWLGDCDCIFERIDL